MALDSIKRVFVDWLFSLDLTYFEWFQIWAQSPPKCYLVTTVSCCGDMLRECMEREALAKILLGDAPGLNAIPRICDLT